MRVRSLSGPAPLPLLTAVPRPVAEGPNAEQQAELAADPCVICGGRWAGVVTLALPVDTADDTVRPKRDFDGSRHLGIKLAEIAPHAQ